MCVQGPPLKEDALVSKNAQPEETLDIGSSAYAERAATGRGPNARVGCNDQLSIRFRCPSLPGRVLQDVRLHARHRSKRRRATCYDKAGKGSYHVGEATVVAVA